MAATRGDAADLREVGQHRATGRALSDTQLDNEWRAVDERKEDTEPPLERAARSYFEWEQEQVLSFLQSHERAWRQQRLEVDINIDDILNVLEAARKLVRNIEPGMMDAIREGFRTGRLRIDAEGPPFDPDNPRVQQVTQELIDVIQNVPRTSRGRLQEIVLEGYADGKDLSTVVDEVQQLYQGSEATEGMTRSRARTIARTTSTAAFEAGQRYSFEANGIAAREWLTTRDGRQRRGHGEANGQRQPMDQPFEVRADTDRPFEQLQFPGDPNASAENVVNCRCTVLPSFGDEQDADNSALAGVVETDGPT